MISNIFKGIRINRVIDVTIDKDSVHYVEPKDQPIIETPIAFPLSRVVYWEKTMQYYHPFDDDKPRVDVDLEYCDSYITLLITFEEFTKIMEDYYNGKQTNTENSQTI